MLAEGVGNSLCGRYFLTREIAMKGMSLAGAPAPWTTLRFMQPMMDVFWSGLVACFGHILQIFTRSHPDLCRITQKTAWILGSLLWYRQVGLFLSNTNGRMALMGHGVMKRT